MAKKYLRLGSVLKRLLFDRGMKPIDLAREVNIPPPTIHRLLTGKSTRPYGSSLQPIADYFSLSVNQLLGEEPLPNQSCDDINKTQLRKIHTLPLIPWENLQSLEYADKSNYNSIPFTGKISESSYATIMNDSSMDPLFSFGTILIFDPKKIFKDRSYVLAQFHDSGLIVFRQLLIDLEFKYLKPLNPDLSSFQMRLLSEKDKIIGTLIEARHLYIEQ